MATLNAANMSDNKYQGEAGNLSIAEAIVQFGTETVAAAGDVINLFELSAGMRINRVAVVNAALGTGVVGQIKSGAKVLVNSQALATAGNADIPIEPYSTLVDKEIVSITVSGGVPTGKLVVYVYFVAEGV